MNLDALLKEQNETLVSIVWQSYDVIRSLDFKNYILEKMEEP